MSDRHVLQVEITKKKIQSLQKELSSKNSAFLNKKYLESLGSPNSIIGRENELNPTKSEKQKLAFARAFRRYSARFSNNN